MAKWTAFHHRVLQRARSRIQNLPGDDARTSIGELDAGLETASRVGAERSTPRPYKSPGPAREALAGTR
jgi:hypothetical protein